MSCAVKGCKNIRRFNLNISFHRFPKDINQQKKWLEVLEIKNPTNWIWSQTKLVCAEHFAEEDFRPYGARHFLKPDVIPSRKTKPCVIISPPSSSVTQEAIPTAKSDNTEEIKDLPPIEEVNIIEEPLHTFETDVKAEPLDTLFEQPENLPFKSLQQSEMVLDGTPNRKANKTPENNLPSANRKKIICYYNKEDISIDNGAFSKLLNKHMLPILKKLFGSTVPDNSVIYFNKNANDASNNALKKQNNVIIMPFAPSEDLFTVKNNNGPVLICENNNKSFNENIEKNSCFSVEQISNGDSRGLEKCEENLLANKLSNCVSKRRKFECTLVENKYKEEYLNNPVKRKKYWINSQRSVKMYKQKIAKLKRKIRSKDSKIRALNTKIDCFTKIKFS